MGALAFARVIWTGGLHSGWAERAGAGALTLVGRVSIVDDYIVLPLYLSALNGVILV